MYLVLKGFTRNRSEMSWNLCKSLISGSRAIFNGDQWIGPPPHPLQTDLRFCPSDLPWAPRRSGRVYSVDLNRKKSVQKEFWHELHCSSDLTSLLLEFTSLIGELDRIAASAGPKFPRAAWIHFQRWFGLRNCTRIRPNAKICQRGSAQNSSLIFDSDPRSPRLWDIRDYWCDCAKN